jgi:hypothetical protein
MLQCSALNGFIVLVRQRRFRRLNTAMYAEPHANLPETKHVDYLDGWRGGAILLLLVGHFAALPTISGHSFYTGRLGVECFFVLSGRLMAEILFLRQIPIGIFYWRRISRIFPALWLFLGALTFATVLYPQIDVTSLKALASVAFLVNYLHSCARQHHLRPQWRDTNMDRPRLLSGLLAQRRKGGLDLHVLCALSRAKRF